MACRCSICTKHHRRSLPLPRPTGGRLACAAAPAQVLICLNALGRLAANIDGFDGPALKLGGEQRGGGSGGRGGSGGGGGGGGGKRASSKVSMLAVSLADKISVAKPPPAVSGPRIEPGGRLSTAQH